MFPHVGYHIYLLLVFICTTCIQGNTDDKDLAINSFNYTFSSARIFSNAPFKVSFTSQAENKATTLPDGNNGALNWDVKVILTDNDNEDVQPVEIKISEEHLQDLNRPMENGETSSIVGTASFGALAPAKCVEMKWLCFKVNARDEVIMKDNDKSNNYICANMSYMLDCGTNHVDLSVFHFTAGEREVHPGTYTQVALRMQVALSGRQLDPPNVDADLYLIHMYLSTDIFIDATDILINKVPIEFEMVKTTRFTSSGYLDVSGYGVYIPDFVSTNTSYHKFCGSVYLIVIIDGPTSPGAILEPNEENNIRAEEIVIFCQGDAVCLKDFTFSLIYSQHTLFRGATLPVTVNATVYNVGDISYPGNRAAFYLSLWLHDSPDLLSNPGSALEVSKYETKYLADMGPLIALRPGQSVKIHGVMWVDGDKFIKENTNTYTHLILRVDAPPIEAQGETVVKNNFDYQIVDIPTAATVDRHFEGANGNDIVIFPNIVRVGSKIYHTSGNDISFNTDVTAYLDNGISGNVDVSIFWSLDDRFDADDVNSGIKINIDSNNNKLTEGDDEDLAMPSDKRVCGVVYAILRVSHASQQDSNDRKMDNNYVASLVSLQCDVSDVLGILQVWKMSDPTLWINRKVPLQLDALISCVGPSCPGEHASNANFQLKFYLTDSANIPAPSAVPFLHADTKDDLISTATNVLGPDLVKRQARISFTIEMQLGSANCNASFKHLWIRIFKADGNEDTFTENNYGHVLLTSKRCDVAGTGANLKIKRCDLDSLAVNRLNPFELVVTTEHTAVWGEQDWPHFDFGIYLSAELDENPNKVEPAYNDYHVKYDMTGSQIKELTKSDTGSDLDLSDLLEGFWLDEKGFERLCGLPGGEVMVDFYVDLYDPDYDDKIRGQIDEHNEHDNHCSKKIVLTGLNCNAVLTNSKKISVSVTNVNGNDLIWAERENTMQIELLVTNENDEPLPRVCMDNPASDTDYVLNAYITDSGAGSSNKATFQLVNGDADFAAHARAGMEAGGSHLITLSVKLCAKGSCTNGEVLSKAECAAIIGSAKILVVPAQGCSAMSTLSYTFSSNEVGTYMDHHVQCSAELLPKIMSIGMPSVLNYQFGYSFPFEVTVLNLHPTKDVPSTTGNFILELYIGKNSVKLAVTLDDNNLLSSAIDSMDNVTLTGTAAENFNQGECDGLLDNSGKLYFTAEIKSLHENLLSDSYPYESSSKDMLETSADSYPCDNDFIDLNVEEWKLLDDSSTQLTSAVIGTSYKFVLKAKVSPKGTEEYSSTGSNNYKAVFFVSPSEDPSDSRKIQMADPYGQISDSPGEMREAVNTEAAHDNLHLKGNNDQAKLTFGGGDAGHFCDHSHVYVLVQLVDLKSVPDPDLRNNFMSTRLALQCPGDYFLLKNVQLAQTTIFRGFDDAQRFFADFDVCNINEDGNEIAAGKNGNDNFNVELHTSGATRADSLIELKKLVYSVPDQARLKQAIPAASCVSFTNVRFDFKIETSTQCNAILSDGIQLALVRSVGLAVDQMDRIKDNNNVWKTNVDCRSDGLDVRFDSNAFSLDTGLVDSSTAGKYKKLDFTIRIVAEKVVVQANKRKRREVNKGGTSLLYSSYKGEQVENFRHKRQLDTDEIRYSIHLSNDAVLDGNDVELKEDKIAHTAYTSSGTFTETLSSQTLEIPNSAQLKYCGLCYLLTILNLPNTQKEVHPWNNLHSHEFILPCEGDVYHLHNIQVYSQEVYWIGKTATFAFSATILNVKDSDIFAAASGANFEFKLYAQVGEHYDHKRAIDVTPSAWAYGPGEQAYNAELHKSSGVSPKAFTWVSGDVILTQSICDMSVDHLIIMVSSITGTEWVLNNNYYSHPMKCGGPDTTDIFVRPGRLQNKYFRLEDNQFTLGEPKPFVLDVEVVVGGSGGWAEETDLTKPVFEYKFSIVDPSTNPATEVMIPHTINTAVINQAVTSDVFLRLDGELTLPPSEFLVVCKDNLELQVELDSTSSILETNELNNMETITGISIVQSGSGVPCSSAVDLVTTTLKLVPESNTLIVIEGSVTGVANIRVLYDYKIRKAPGSTAPDPVSFNIQFVMSADGAAGGSSIVDLDGTQTLITVADAHPQELPITITTTYATDVKLLPFCGRDIFFGVVTDSTNSVQEIDDSIDYTMIPINLECPDVKARALLEFTPTGTNKDGNIRADVDTTITFDAVVINSGTAMDATPGNKYDFELYILDNDEVDPVAASATPVTAAFTYPPQSPSRSDAFLEREIHKFSGVQVKVNLANSDCKEKDKVCLYVKSENGLDILTTDNFICINVTDGLIGIDCSRDLSTMLGAIQPVGVDQIYQDTLTPLSFQANVPFQGRTIEASADGTSHISFEVYASDQDNINPTAQYNGGAELMVGNASYVSLTPTSTAALSGRLDETIGPAGYTAEGSTSIFIDSAVCSTTTHLCLKYVVVTDLTPQFRDANSGNDHACVQKTFACTDNTVDLKPKQFDLYDNIVEVDTEVMFDLQVALELRGTMKGSFKFKSQVFLSRTAELDGSEEQIEYYGFDNGIAHDEMTKSHLTGDHILEMGGIPFVIPSSTSYCGNAVLTIILDTNSDVSERYENNNLINEDIVMSCHGDELTMMSDSNGELPDKLWSESLVPISMNLRILNVGNTKHLSSYAEPIFSVQIKAVTTSSTEINLPITITEYPEHYFMDLLAGYEATFKMEGLVDTTALTKAYCDSLDHLNVCTIPSVADSHDNQCKDFPVEDLETVCTVGSEQRDIILQRFKFPDVVMVSSEVRVEHDLLVMLGSTAIPITPGLFISTLYLSRTKTFEKNEMFKVADIWNTMDITATDSPYPDRVVDKAVTVLPPSDPRFCGKVYALMVADSMNEIKEYRESNNALDKRVTVICDGQTMGNGNTYGVDRLSVLDFDFMSAEDTLVVGPNNQVKMSVSVTCVSAVCSIPESSSSDNIRFELASLASLESGAVSTPIETLDSVWASTHHITPHLTSGFPATGYTIEFEMKGVLIISPDMCGPNGEIYVQLTVHDLSNSDETLTANNKDVITYKCKQEGDRDLVAKSLVFHNGWALNVEELQTFTLTMDLKGLAIPPIDAAPPASLLKFRFYLSDDDELDERDIHLPYVISHCSAARLSSGLAADSLIEIIDNDKGLKFPEDASGPKKVIAWFDDKNHVEESMDSNNFAVASIHLVLRNDLLQMLPIPAIPEMLIWQTKATILTFDVMVLNVAMLDIPATLNPLLRLRIFTSEDPIYHPLNDTMLNSQVLIPQKIDDLLKTGIKAGETVKLEGISVKLTLTPDECTNIKFLIVAALPSEDVPIVDSHLKNNVQPLALNTRCSGLDLVKKTLYLGVDPSDNEVTPGTAKDLNLEFTVEASTSNPFDPAVALEYAFWLSTDSSLEPSEDLMINYNYPASLASLSTLTSPSTVSLSDTAGSGGILVPETVEDKWCGIINLLVMIDPNNAVDEIDETNNLDAVPILVKCSNDLFSESGLVITQPENDELMVGTDSRVTVDLTISCIGNSIDCPDDATSGANEYHHNLKLFVVDSEGYELADLNPNVIDKSWVQQASGDGDDFTGLGHPDSLRRDFTSNKDNPLTLNAKIKLNNNDRSICEKVKSMCVELLKGNSDQLKDKTLGPQASKVRCASINTNCQFELLTLTVDSFDVTPKVGGVTIINISDTDNLKFNLSMTIGITAANLPRNDDKKPLLFYDFTISGDGMPDEKLNYEIPDSILSILRASSFVTGNLVLSHSMFEFDMTQIKRYSGKSGVTIHLNIDPLHDLVYNDVSASVPINVIYCKDEMDLGVKYVLAQEKAVSGETISVNTSIYLATIGPLGFYDKTDLPNDHNYDFKFSLQDSKNNPINKILVFNTSQIAERSQECNENSPHCVADGCAFDLSGLQLYIPPDHSLCDKSWFLCLEAEWNTSYAVNDPNIENNKGCSHIHINCRADMMALDAVEYEFPAKWWAESQTTMDVQFTIANQGDVDIPYATPNAVVKMYYSTDEIYDQQDTEMVISMLTGNIYDNYQMIPAKSTVQSPPLKGHLYFASYAACEEAKKNKPTIHFRLVPTISGHSTYLENDIISIPVPEDILKCDANLDLGIDVLDIPEKIRENEDINYYLSISMTKTPGASITSSTDHVSFDINFYLSNDAKKSEEDPMLDLVYTKDQKDLLQRGVDDATPPLLNLDGNLKINIRNNPKLEFYCGSTFVLVEVRDLKNTPSIDPVPENNIKAKLINLLCAGDLVAFENLQLEPVYPQEKIYPDVATNFVFHATLHNYGSVAIDGKQDKDPIFFFNAFMSYDAQLDVTKEPAVDIIVSEEIKKKTLEPIGVNQTATFDGIISIKMEQSVCGNQPRYLAIAVMLSGQVITPEDILANNYEYIMIRESYREEMKPTDLLNCSLSWKDLEVIQFEVTNINNNVVKQGDSLEFKLFVNLRLSGSAFLGIPSEFNPDRTYAFKYNFYLSHDETIDKNDLNLGYSMKDHEASLLDFYPATKNVSLDSQSEHLMIPTVLHASFCGSINLIAYLDDVRDIEEPDEFNNLFIQNIVMTCELDTFELLDVAVQPQAMYFKNLGVIIIDFAIRNMLGVQIEESPGTQIVFLKVYIRGSSDKVMHDVTPQKWVSRYTSLEVLINTMFAEGLKRDFIGYLGMIDITPACTADLDPIETGQQQLVFRAVKGDNPQLLYIKDCNDENNMFVTEVQADCGDNIIDLYWNTTYTTQLNDGDIVFGKNYFSLFGQISAKGSVVWDKQPSGPNDKMQFNYQFQVQGYRSDQDEIRTQILKYSTEPKKNLINDRSYDGKIYDFSDSTVGLDIPKSDFAYLCVASQVSIIIKIDSDNQFMESDESEENNIGIIFPKTDIIQEDCTDNPGKDFSVKEWSIELESGKFKPGETYRYFLTLWVDLIGGEIIPNHPTKHHFKIKFFLSDDEEYDNEDLEVTVQLTPLQEKEIKEYYSFGVKEKMDLQSKNLMVSLSRDTYYYCWRHIYMGIYIDVPYEHENGQISDDQDEINEDNNIDFYPIIFDCEDAVNECEQNLHNCDINATCQDHRYHLYERHDVPFQCHCNDGYKGNGTFCQDIDECTELDVDSSALHDCGANSQCVNEEPFFLCSCDNGYTEVDGAEGNKICKDINECGEEKDSCDKNADCQNTIGSFICQCYDGFSGDGHECTKIATCDTYICLNNGICEDRGDDISCRCQPNFYAGQFCEIANGNWGAWGGWSTCLSTCGAGVQTRTRHCSNPTPTENGKACRKDEASYIEERYCNNGNCISEFRWCDSDPCGESTGGVCLTINNGQHYQCICRQPGYKIVSKLDNSGQELVFSHCEDVNECEEIGTDGRPLHDCDVNLAICENTVASFICKCKEGLTGDGRHCEDIDECKSPGSNECDTNADCINKAGTYDCECQWPKYKKEKWGDPRSGLCLENRIHAYGEEMGDTLVTTLSDISGERVSDIIHVPCCLPIAGGQLCCNVYISENGILVCTKKRTQDNRKETFPKPVEFQFQLLPTDTDIMLIIAPFWANSMTETNTSKILYQTYQDTTNPLFETIQAALKKDLNIDVILRFIIKVTWSKMLPHFMAQEEEWNTFQLILATDYRHTYASYIYDLGNMKWNPVYSPTEIALIYGGYPARIGYTNRLPDTTMFLHENVISGKYTSEHNAYWADLSRLHPDQDIGTVAYQVDDNDDDFTNPCYKCVEWYSKEPPIDKWAKYLIDGCPNNEFIAEKLDKRYKLAVTNDKAERCYDNIFPIGPDGTAHFFSENIGGQMRCCYRSNKILAHPGVVLNPDITNYEYLGFISRYPRNTTKHFTDDKEPFNYCCVDARNYGLEYCEMYLEKRPIAQGGRYNRPIIGLTHGDPHIVTLDGLSYTFNGLGEYVMLMPTSYDALYVMMQARTEPVDSPLLIFAKGTRISAFAVKVGSENEPSIQVYRTPETEDELEIFIDESPWKTSDVIPGVSIEQTVPSQVEISFREGISVTIHVAQKYMYVQPSMPETLATGKYKGLYGNYDKDPENDIQPENGDRHFYVDTATPSDIHFVMNGYNLRNVFGLSDLARDASDYTLFLQYGPTYSKFPSANEYFDLSYSPKLLTRADFVGKNDILTACTHETRDEPTNDCLIDYMIAGQTVAAQTLINRIEFDDLRKKSSNLAPRFTNGTTKIIRTQVDQETIVLVEVVDETGEDVSIFASVKNGLEQEQLVNTKLNTLTTTSGSVDVHTASFAFTPVAKGVYKVELKASDATFSSLYLPYLILCVCEHDGVCDYGNVQNQMAGTAYACCGCGPGYSGNFCEQDMNGCEVNYHHCYNDETCVDHSAADVVSSESKQEFTCGACPDNLMFYDNTCSDVNECLLDVGDPNRHECNQTCINRESGYICACEDGYTLEADRKSCLDNDECARPQDNDCNDEHGHCINLPGTYTCECSPGFTLTDDNSCQDINECTVKNGGCEAFCINTPGSRECACPSGFKSLTTDPTQCEMIDLCAEENKCDQTCIPDIKIYRCECGPEFKLAEDGHRCKPIDEGCVTLVCDERAFCGVEGGVEKCFCPKGYKLQATNFSHCEDVDECRTNIDSCKPPAKCKNIEGNFQCECPQGTYLPLPTSRECQNIDECLGSNNCSQVCRDTFGSYVCECRPGYMLKPDGISCIDIDECLPGHVHSCSPDATCRNIQGSYECNCNLGYEGNGFICSDKDECQVDRGGCALACINTIGSYRCGCVEGQMIDDSNPNSCIDVNECYLPEIVCTSFCYNKNPGSYQCACKYEDNYRLDTDKKTCLAPIAQTCEEPCEGGICVRNSMNVKQCECYSGFMKGTGSLDKCLDVDECTEDIHYCQGPLATCTNIPGGYKCMCAVGYTIDPNGTRCSDTDECNTEVSSDKHQCDVSSSRCINTEGSYTCQCLPGYLPQPGSDKICQDVNECDKSLKIHKCSCNANCTNIPGGYECKCDEGYSGDGLTCHPLNECSSPFLNDCDQSLGVCVDQTPGYYCRCKEGYKWDYFLKQCIDIDECKSKDLNKCEFLSGCVNLEGRYRCTCYDGSILSNDGFTCINLRPCKNPSLCVDKCVNNNGTDTCICAYPNEVNLADKTCRDINECKEASTCGSNTKCVNKQPLFECQCLSPYLPDDDGLSCPETNGLWTSWTDYTNCSKSCHGRQQRTRKCDNPPPKGNGRMCPGEKLDIKMCNTGMEVCLADESQSQSGISIEMAIPPTQWEDVEMFFFSALRSSINMYCKTSNETYLTCCGIKLTGSDLPEEDAVVNPILGRAYPRSCGPEAPADCTRVIVVAEIQTTSGFCQQDGGSSVNLGQDMLLEIAEGNTTREELRKELCYNKKLEFEDILDYVAAVIEFEDVVPTTVAATVPPVDEGLSGGEIAAIVICVLIALIILIVIAVCYMKSKGKKDDMGSQNSVSGGVEYVDEEEEKPKRSTSHRSRRSPRVSPSPTSSQTQLIKSRPATQASWVEPSDRAPSRMSEAQIEAHKEATTQGDVQVQDAEGFKEPEQEDPEDRPQSAGSTAREDTQI